MDKNRVPQAVAKKATTADLDTLQGAYGKRVTLPNGIKINSTWYSNPKKDGGTRDVRAMDTEYKAWLKGRNEQRTQLFNKATSGRMAGIKFATIATAARASGLGNARLGIDPVMSARSAGGGGGGRRG